MKQQIAPFFFILGFLLIFTSSTCIAQDKFAEQMDLASKAVEEGKYEEAIKIYSSILQEDPANFAAQVWLARTYYFAGNVNPDYFYKAISEYHKVIEKWPDFSLSYLHLGQIAYLLGLKTEIEGREKHARGLYQSAIEWLEKYIQLQAKDKTLNKEREILRTRILQAVIYNRLGEEKKALELVVQAKKDYREVSPKEWGASPLLDYFIRSSIDYIASKLYNQAIIYLEGAWLIEPQPQIEKLFKSITKLKGVEISLKSLPEQKEEEKIAEVAPEERPQKEKIRELQKQIDVLGSKLEVLPSMEEKLEVLKEKVEINLELKQDVEDLARKINEIKKQMENLSELKPKVNQLENQLKGEMSVREKLDKKVLGLEEKISLIPGLEEKVKSFDQQKSDISDLKKRIEEVEQIIQQGYTLKSGETPSSYSNLEKKLEELKKEFDALLNLQEKVRNLEAEINKLDERIKKIKSAADKINVLDIQIKELKKHFDELENRINLIEEKISEKQEG